MINLVSFELCPFVQRSVMTLKYKQIPFEIKYIDLANKPQWFLDISPLGKVPLLQVDGEVLFESAVINEYLDEISEGSLLPSDPLLKAKDRAYIELAGVLTFAYFHSATAQTKEEYLKYRQEFEKHIVRFLDLYQGPFFKGADFSLVDTSIIPALQRMILTPNLFEQLELSDAYKAKLKAWIDHALKQDFVKDSVPEQFNTKYLDYIVQKGSYICKM